jgi:hypothetical protein
MVYNFTFLIRFFVLFIVNILLPGIFWSWAFPKDIKSIWQKGVIAIFIGFIFSLSLSFLFNTLCLNSLTVNVLGSLVFALSGYNIGYKRGYFSSHELEHTLFSGLRISIVFVLIFLFFNLNSQWIMGGWDPGIYTNQGLNIANKNGFVQPVGFEDDDLMSDEILMISKVPDEMVSPIPGEEYRELLPGVRIDVEKGDVSNLFFRNFPSFIGMLSNWGLVDFGLKANVFAGLMTVLIFIVLAYRMFGSFYSVAFCLMLFFHSLFLYHIKLPTTEVLQMALFFGFVLLNSWRTNLFISVFSALIFFCAVTNRAGFIAFGSLYLFFVCLAKTTTDESRKERFTFLVLTCLGLICGLIYDIIYSSNTIIKLNYVLDKLFMVALASIIGSVIVTAFSNFFKIYLLKLVDVFENRKNGYITACLLILATIVITFFVYNKSDYPANQIKMLISYFGMVTLLFVFAGMFFMLFDPKTNIYAKTTVVFLIVVSIVTFSNQYVANLYPWAVRRYVTYTLPLIILSAIYLPCVLWRSKKVFPRVLAVMFIFVICISQARSTFKVLIHSEYRGILVKLEELDNELDDESLILVDDHRFATPLMYIYGHKVMDNALLVSKVCDENSANRYYNLLKKMHDRGHSVYFFTTKHLSKEPSFPFEIVLSNIWNSAEFETTEVVHGENQKAFEYKSFAISPSLYKIVDFPEYKLNSLSMKYIDVGKDFDFLNIESGLYDSELSDGKTVRWTSDCAKILIPVENTNHAANIKVNYILKHRPVPVKEIIYRVNGARVSAVAGSTNVNEISDSFQVEPSVLLYTNILEIIVDPFVPRSVTGSMDNRKLGIMLDSIEISN